MTKFIMTNPVFREFDADGLPLAGGYAYFYAAGTDTPKDVYQDAAGVAAHPNPVILDSRGEAVIYGNGAYKVITKTPSGTTVRTVDNYKILNISPFAETLLDDDDAASIRATLELGSAALLDAGTNPNNVVQLDANNPARLPAVDGRALDLTNMPDANLPASALAFPRSYLSGLSISNSTSGESPDADHDIDIAAGECRDSTHTENIVLDSAITKQLDASWEEGDFAGMLDGGEVQIDTWYHIFVIKNPTTGTVDVLASTSASAPTLPEGYTKFRRIGSVRTDADANIQAFMQHGDWFYWQSPVLETSGGNNYITIGISRTTFRIYQIPNYRCIALLQAMNNQVSNINITCPDFPEVACMSKDNVAPPLFNVTGYTERNDHHFCANSIQILTDSQGRVAANADFDAINLVIMAYGWIDRRGRDD